MQRIALSIAAATLICGSLNAAEPSGKIEQQVIKELVPQVVGMIGHLGRGEIDKARGTFTKYSMSKPKTGPTRTGPFGEQAKWNATFGSLAQTKPEFESVELIGVQKLSTQAFRISLIAHARYGPVMFTCRAFAYRGKLYAVSLHYEANWDRNEMRIAMIKNKLSKVYPIRAAQTAKNKSATKK